MISTLLLDLDGTLLDSQVRHYAVYRDILAENGFPFLESDDYWQRKRRAARPLDLLMATAATAISETFREEWAARIERADYLALDTVLPGVLETLRKWRSEGRRLLV